MRNSLPCDVSNPVRRTYAIHPLSWARDGTPDVVDVIDDAALAPLPKLFYENMHILPEKN